MAKNYPEGCSCKGRDYFFLLKSLVCLPTFFLWGKEISGRKNIPPQVSFLVVVNHQSFLDFLLITLALRQFGYVAGFIKQKYYDLPIFSFFLKDMAQIRADKHCMKKALECLEKGFPVVLFPEGTRTRDGLIGPIYSGIEVIAKAFPDMPVLPVGISGAFDIWPWNWGLPRWFGGRKVSVKIGKPLYFADFDAKEGDFACAVMSQVALLAGKK